MTSSTPVARFVLSACAAALLIPACGGSGTSMTEYVEQLDGIFRNAIEKYEALVATPEGLVLIVGHGPHLGLDDQGAELADFTPQDLQIALEQLVEIQEEAVAAAASIEPPDQIAELHDLYFRELPMAELAARAATAADWQELSDSPEMDAYRSALAADNQVCADFQAKLDATAAQGAFADTPWVPGRLEEIVDFALGCDAAPANPEDIYRPSPTAIP